MVLSYAAALSPHCCLNDHASQHRVLVALYDIVSDVSVWNDSF